MVFAECVVSSEPRRPAQVPIPLARYETLRVKSTWRNFHKSSSVAPLVATPIMIRVRTNRTNQEERALAAAAA